VYENGTFVIRDMNRESDRGKYTCRAISRSGEEIYQDLHIDVLSELSLILEKISEMS